jgi:PAS domain S-box-containing protein
MSSAAPADPKAAQARDESLFKAAILRWLDEFSSQGILTTCPDLIIRGWNRWLELNTGHKASEVIGRHLFELYPELKERHLDRYYEEALRGESRVLSHRLHRFLLPMRSTVAEKYSGWMQQSACISPLRHDGEVIGTITVIEDVTGRVIREAELEEVNRVKDDFLAMVSHELRTPLTAILGWSRLLRTGAVPADEVNRALEIIERNAKNQSLLIGDLLDISRIISGKLRLEIQAVDLKGVVEAAIDSVRLAADAASVRIESASHGGEGLVSGDPTRLLQVVSNLLSNSIKFTPPGGRVNVDVNASDNCVELVISDTGQGISPELLPHVFDPFWQAEGSTTKAHGGLGLGLAIVRSLVELHGGAVEVTSPGLRQGATFTVRLPAVQPRSGSTGPPGGERQSAPAAARREDVDPSRQLDGVHVLIVDDEEDTRVVLTSILKERRARVTTVNSAAEGLIAVEELLPDVLISDLGMPVEDGYALIRQVRSLALERGGNTPAIALSAYARAEDRTRVLLSGFQMHVAKPVEPDELVNVVANLARRS